MVNILARGDVTAAGMGGGIGRHRTGDVHLNSHCGPGRGAFPKVHTTFPPRYTGRLSVDGNLGIDVHPSREINGRGRPDGEIEGDVHMEVIHGR